jgi:DNA-directed RNA polymerase subunit F
VPAESSSNHATVTSFGLTEAEAIQIANFMPTEPVEIHLMVEELHNRMTEAKQQELLQCIASYRKDTDDK